MRNDLFCHTYGKFGLLRYTPCRSAKDRNFHTYGPVDALLLGFGLYETPVVRGRLHVLCRCLVLPLSRYLTTIVIFYFDSKNLLQARI